MPTVEIEYERTFLAREIPAEVHAALPSRMVDLYIPADPAAHPRLRIRRKGTVYEITKKEELHGADSSVQTEQTIPLTQQEFEELASGHGRMVEKDRYGVTIAGHPAEVDVFSGELEGLVLIDFEFENEQDKDAFTPPACCLAEVTQELFAAGGQLSGKAYSDIEADLARFKYQPLHL